MMMFRPGQLQHCPLRLIFGGGRGQENAVNWSCPHSGTQLLYTDKEEERSSLSSWSLPSAFVTVHCHLSALADATLFIPILGWLPYQCLKGRGAVGFGCFSFLLLFLFSPSPELICLARYLTFQSEHQMKFRSQQYLL